MATLYVTEFARLGVDTGKFVPAPMEPDIATQAVVIGGGSLQSAAFNAVTTVIELHTDAICSIKFGTDPTAAITARRMAAGETRCYVVPKGAAYKVAVIENA